MSAPSQLYSTLQVAVMLNLDPAHVRRLAAQLDVGQKLGRDWFFTESDVDVLRNRPNPRQRNRPNDPK